MRQGILGWLLIIALGAGSYMAPRPWFVIPLILMVAAIVAMERWRVRREVVTALRRLRHRQANHMQVIDGWLQLGRTERAAEYVREASVRIGQEGAWYRELPLSWLYSVLVLDLLAESRGIRCQWHISPLAPDLAGWIRFRRSVRSAIMHAGAAMDVHLDQHGFVISLPDPKSVPRPGCGVSAWQQGDTIVLIWRAAGQARQRRRPTLSR